MRNVLISFTLLAVLLNFSSVLAHDGSKLEETVFEAANYVNSLNVSTEYDGFVKPLLPFTGELVVIDSESNATVKVTLTKEYKMLVNSDKNPDVTVVVSDENYDLLYNSIMDENRTHDDLIDSFNAAGVVVIPRSTKAEIGVSLVKKYSPLNFEVQKEKGVFSSIRSVVSGFLVGVINVFAGLLGLRA